MCADLHLPVCACPPQVHKFAQALQLLDVMLFKYMVLAEPDIQAVATQSQCGYVTTPAK